MTNEIPSIRGTQTEKNLVIAFAGECQARNRYQYFAEKARKEGYQKIADILERTAQQEQSHAKQFFRFLEGGSVEITSSFSTGVGNTAENLHEAIAGELNEAQDLYIGFAATAKAEGFPKVAAIFRVIAKAEAEHARRFQKWLDKLEQGTLYKSGKTQRWECSKCGYVHEGEEPPSICPACQHPVGYFEPIDD